MGRYSTVVVDADQPAAAVADALAVGPGAGIVHGHHERSTTGVGRVAAAAPAGWEIGVAVRRWCTALGAVWSGARTKPLVVARRLV